MKLHSLIYFIAIADLKSYTKAATRFYITQPALSKAIAQLEDELDCTLFEKQGRTLELSENGKIVYESARKIVYEIDNLKNKLQQNLNHFHLSVGYVIFGHLDYLLKRVNQLHSFELTTIYDNTVKTKKNLLEGIVDIAILPNNCEKELKGVEVFYLTRNKLHILVSKDHPLFSQNKVRFCNLKDISIIGWDSNDTPGVATSYDEAFMNAGIQPKIVARGKKLGDVVTLMLQHQAIGLCLPYTASLSENEYKTIPIEDSEEIFGLCLVWKKENKNPAIVKLIEYL